MRNFLDQDFLLSTDSARRLYHEHAASLPIIDYHCHLDPALIATDHRFGNLSQIWLAGDHYKWRAMRANGVDERFITGEASDREKFLKWAETVPASLRNPLYHWTHLELQRYFGIGDLLGPETAEGIYDKAGEMLSSDEFSVRKMIRKMKVESICTTDDPVDSLEHHRKIREDGFETLVLPTWRPDKAMAVDAPDSYNTYLDELEKASGISIDSYPELLKALKVRHEFFHEEGCRISDHGLESFPAFSKANAEAKAAESFLKVRSGKALDRKKAENLKACILFELALMDHARGWVQQFHVGAIRNNNRRQFSLQGPDTGYDSIGDRSMASNMSALLDRLDSHDRLARTIVYNLNPADNALMATMIYNFSDGRIPGKMQFGSGWWFLDQKYGMTEQINTLSSLGLLSHFVGMLTDSRSFMSYPRHEYFRRLLCELVGTDIEKGEIPDQPELSDKLVRDVSYYNAKSYFAW